MNVRKRVIEILEDCDFVDDVSTVFEKILAVERLILSKWTQKTFDRA